MYDGKAADSARGMCGAVLWFPMLRCLVLGRGGLSERICDPRPPQNQLLMLQPWQMVCQAQWRFQSQSWRGRPLKMLQF